jgi:hypothetical protein
MKACYFLLRYLMTWMRPLAWLVWLGLALLGGVIGAGLFGPDHVAFGLSVYTFATLLALPYLIAWHPFRVMLSCRRLALIPGFRLQLGFALLLFTLLLAVFMPLASQLFWPGALSPRFAVAVFVGASLFTFVVQWTVASPYAALVFSVGPFVLIYMTIKLWPLLFLVFHRDASLALVALAGALGWVLALRTLNTRRDFHPPRKAALNARDYIWEGRSDWLGILIGNYKGAVKSAEGTLLLGYPDSLPGRFFAMLTLTFWSPMVSMILLYATGFASATAGSGNMPGMFLGFSLMATIAGGFGNGELAARSRLLWLRRGGTRTDYWQRLEQRVLSDTAVLALIVVPITGVALMMFDAISFDPLTYCLTALACNVLGNYFSLAARLSQWSLFLQFVIATAMAAGLILGRMVEVLSLPVLVALVLGLAWLFRQQALRYFTAVDWAVLRPACQAFNGNPS